MNPDDAGSIISFLKAYPLAVISTIDSQTNAPEAALVAFAETDQCELIFETFYDARKYANLKRNPKVAFVIGGSVTDYRTLQYEGIAMEAVNTREIEEYKNILRLKKTPCTEEFLSNPKVRMFKVTPTLIIFSDYTKSLPNIACMRFPKSEV